jgi:hypothetical protein
MSAADAALGPARRGGTLLLARLLWWLALLTVTAGVGRIVATYDVFGVTFDEPAHIARRHAAGTRSRPGKPAGLAAPPSLHFTPAPRTGVNQRTQKRATLSVSTQSGMAGRRRRETERQLWVETGSGRLQAGLPPSARSGHWVYHNGTAVFDPFATFATVAGRVLRRKTDDQIPSDWGKDVRGRTLARFAILIGRTQACPSGRNAETHRD